MNENIAPRSLNLTLKNPLVRLVLEAIQRSNGYAVPESTLVSEFTNAVRPPATLEDFRDVFLLICQREFAGFRNDDATDERMFFLKEKGKNYLESI